MVGGAAGDDHDPLQLAQEVVVELDLGEVDPLVAGQAVGDRLGDGVGLFVDLLQHEGLIAALLGGVGVPGRSLRRRGSTGSPSASVIVTPPASIVTISPFSISIARAGVGEEGRDRRGEEGLALADPGDQRALLAGADQPPGLVGVHGDEGVVAAQLGEGGAHRGGEVAVVVAGDQVGDDLGVGLGGERLPFGLQLGAAASRGSRRSR